MIMDVLAGAPVDLVVIADDDAVVAAGFAEPAAILAMVPERSRVVPGELPEIRAAWQAYLAGQVRALDDIPVRQQGTPMRELVWETLRSIPPGHPVGYGELAARIGRPGAARAVGSACGSNRVAPFVPCHRVIAADGSLGGYGYGESVKRWLLDHEAAHT